MHAVDVMISTTSRPLQNASMIGSSLFLKPSISTAMHLIAADGWQTSEMLLHQLIGANPFDANFNSLFKFLRRLLPVMALELNKTSTW